MEWFLGLLFGGAALFVAFVLPIILHVRLGRLRLDLDRDAYAKGSTIDALLLRVARLEKELAKRPALQAPAQPPEPAPAPAPAPPPKIEVLEAAPTPAQPPPSDPQPVTRDPQPVTRDPQPATGDPQPAPRDPQPVTRDPQEPARPEAPATPAAPPPPQPSFEDRLVVWLTRSGAIAFLLGIAYFFKYAVDNDWIGPLGRVTIGVVVGAGVLAFAEQQRARAQALYINILCGVGLATLLFSAYASFAFYHLIPMPAAFLALVTIVVLGGALAYRYHAEAILVMSLIAGFATPILLSTGKDNPLGLFGYLLVLTALNYTVALARGFPVALWIGMLGTSVLYVGWYGKFFKIHGPPLHPSADVPIEQLTGAYHELSRRLVPIAAVTLFFVEWLAVYWVARRRSLDKILPVWLLVYASLVGHVGYASLLHDKRPALGLIMVALALIFVRLLRDEQRTNLLLFPMLASFATLMALVRPHEQEKPLSMILLLSAWGLIYSRAFLVDGWKAGQPPPRSTLILLGLSGLLFGLGAIVLLGSHHPLKLLLVMIVLSGLGAAIGVQANVAAMPAVALVGTFLVFLSSLDRHNGETNLAYLGEALAWALVYIGAIAYDLFWRKQPATRARTAMVALASFGFPLLAFQHVATDERVLRAASLLLMAICNFGIGAQLLRRPAVERPYATIHLGLALGLFAATAAVLLSGASVTLIWAALGATVVILALQHQDRAWLWGGAFLLLASAWRAATIDLRVTDGLLDEFLWSGGERGKYLVLAFFNQRAVGLIGTAIACLVAAQRVNRAKIEEGPWQRWSQGLFIVGHTLLVTALVKESHQLFLSLPAQPTGLSKDEFTLFREQIEQLQHHARLRNSMLTTLVMGLYATVLVGIGFGLRNAPSRFIGLGLFALTLGKIVINDVWRLPQLFQILVLLGVGGLVLAATFLYARYRKRLVEILKDGPRVLLPFLLLAASAAHAEVKIPSYAQQRALTGDLVDGGYYAVEIDPALLQASKSASCHLCELRIVGPGGEAPLLVRAIASAPEPPSRRAAQLLSPVVLADGSTQATFDLGESEVTNELDLEIDGRNFLRRTKVEISPDGKAWALLTQYGHVYDVPDGSRDLRLRYPATRDRFVRVTLLGKPGEPPLPIRGGTLRNRPAAWQPQRRTVVVQPQAAPADKLPPKTSGILLPLSPGVPFDEVTFDIADKDFDRRLTLSAATHLAYWTRVADTHVYSIGAEQRLAVRFSPTTKQTLKVELYDGDSPPLTIRGATLSYSPEEIVFQARGAGAHTLYVGADLPAGEYDIATVLPVKKPPIGIATAGPLVANPEFGKGPAPVDQRPFTEKNQGLLVLIIGGIVALLGAYTVVLLRKKPDGDPS